MRRIFVVLSALLALGLMAGPAFAHHGKGGHEGVDRNLYDGLNPDAHKKLTQEEWDEPGIAHPHVLHLFVSPPAANGVAPSAGEERSPRSAC
jgi:hypothetical protein